MKMTLKHNFPIKFFLKTLLFYFHMKLYFFFNKFLFFNAKMQVAQYLSVSANECSVINNIKDVQVENEFIS